jgi:hypothetical protein
MIGDRVRQVVSYFPRFALLVFYLPLNCAIRADRTERDRDKYKGLYENAAAAQVAAQSKLGELSDQLEGEKKNSSKALAQIELHNQQIGALRQQGRHWRLRSTSPRRRITTLMNVLPNSASKTSKAKGTWLKRKPISKRKKPPNWPTGYCRENHLVL